MTVMTILKRLFSGEEKERSQPAAPSPETEREQRAREFRVAMLGHMSALGGFDTWLQDDEQNWCRQLEIMRDHEQRIAALEAAMRKGDA